LFGWLRAIVGWKDRPKEPECKHCWHDEWLYHPPDRVVYLCRKCCICGEAEVIEWLDGEWVECFTAVHGPKGSETFAYEKAVKECGTAKATEFFGKFNEYYHKEK
jgi:hypothetical protein